MANDTESVDSNGNSSDLRPRRSNRAKGKQVANQIEETDDNIVVNNVAYKVGDFIYYIDKKQDILRIGLIEELKFQKRDKLSNKKAEITIKQFYRLEEIPDSVLSNKGEYDTHIMPQNFPEWLRLREIFISDNNLSISTNSLYGLCSVRHFPDLNHAMALFSFGQSPTSGQSPRLDHHSILIGKDPNSSLPVPKHRDDNTFFYVFSYNPRGRKLAVTYLEIRVGGAYQAELPEFKPLNDRQVDPTNYPPRSWEQLQWKPNQIPEEVYEVYHCGTRSLALFSGFGGGVDDSASLENGMKVSGHMLIQQNSLDILHKCHYNIDKATELFAENSLPEPHKIPYLWTDEDHTLFDESVKIYGKNFLKIKQDKRNKKGRPVGDFVTFYYFWKKNRPKNRKYGAKKMLRSRINIPNAEHTEIDHNNATTATVKVDNTIANEEGDSSVKPINGHHSDSTTNGTSSSNNPTVNSNALASMTTDQSNSTAPPSPTTSTNNNGESTLELCSNCKSCLPKSEKECEDKSSYQLSERLRNLCDKCQSYLRRYGYQRPLDLFEPVKSKSTGLVITPRKSLNDDDDDDDKDENPNDDDDDDDDGDAEDEDDDEVFNAHSNNNVVSTNVMTGGSSSLGVSITSKLTEDNNKFKSTNSDNNKNTLAINKYDFDQEDENVEEVSSLLKRNHAKQNLIRDGKSTSIYSGGGGGGKSNSSGQHPHQTSKGSGQSFNGKSSGNSATTGSKAQSCDSSSGKRSLQHSKRNIGESGLNSCTTTPGSNSSAPSSKRRKTTNILGSTSLNASYSENFEDNASSRSTNSNKSGILANYNKLNNIVQLNSSNQSAQIQQSQHHHHHSHHSHHNSKQNKYSANNNASNNSSKNKHSTGNNSPISDSSSSNDSSSSSSSEDEKNSVKYSNNNNNSKSKIITTNNNVKDTPINEQPSYNQMITQIPNIPGVCAVTEPLTSLDNLTVKSEPNIIVTCGDLPVPLKCGASTTPPDHNIHAQPIYTEDTVLNLVKKRVPPTSGQDDSASCGSRNGASVTPLSTGANSANSSINTNTITATLGLPLPAQSLSSLSAPSASSSISSSAPSSTMNYAWSQSRHESPSKLMHYRSEFSSVPPLGDPNSHFEHSLPPQILHGYEVGHHSIFGHLLRKIKRSDGNICSRTDMEHYVSELKPSELEERQRHHNQERIKQNASHMEDRKDDCMRSMPPPLDKPMKLLGNIPPGLNQSSGSGMSSSSSSRHKSMPPGGPPLTTHLNSHLFSSPVQSPMMNVRAPLSLAGINNNGPPPSRTPQSTPQNLPQGMQPSPHQQQPPMQQSSSQANPLLNDYVNANKMATDLLIYQSLQMHNEQLMMQQQQQQQQQAATLLALMRSAGQAPGAGMPGLWPPPPSGLDPQQQASIPRQQQQQQQQQHELLSIFNYYNNAAAAAGGASGGGPSIDQSLMQAMALSAATQNNPTQNDAEAIQALRFLIEHQQQQQQAATQQQNFLNLMAASCGGGATPGGHLPPSSSPQHSNKLPPPPYNYPNQPGGGGNVQVGNSGQTPQQLKQPPPPLSNPTHGLGPHAANQRYNPELYSILAALGQNPSAALSSGVVPSSASSVASSVGASLSGIQSANNNMSSSNNSSRMGNPR